MTARLMSISEWQERDEEKKMLLGPDAKAATPGQVFLADKELAKVLRDKPAAPKGS